MAAISTPGRARAARAWVSVIFPPPISPMYVVIWSAATHSKDRSSFWNLPLSRTGLFVSRPGAKPTLRWCREVSARTEGDATPEEFQQPISRGTRRERHRARCIRRELSPVYCEDAGHGVALSVY